MAALPRYVHVEGLPANESLEHFTLKWAAYRVLTAHLRCPFALVEASARAGLSGAAPARWPRHDALGIRFRPGRTPAPWVDVPATQVRMEALDAVTGRWTPLAAAGLADALGPPDGRTGTAALPDVPTDTDPDTAPGGPAAEPDGGTGTLRAFEIGPGGAQTPLRAVAPGGTPGTLRVRRSGGTRRELVQVCAADAKQSRADLQAWLAEAPGRLRSVHAFLIVAPAGLCRPDELPPKVGLAEVDLQHLLGADGQPAIRLSRWPEPLRPATPWAPERVAEFHRHAYYAMHGLLDRRLFWFLAQEALDRRRRAGGTGSRAAEGRAGRPAAAAETPAAGEPARDAPGPEPAAVRQYTAPDRAAVTALWVRTGLARPWLDLDAEIDRHQRRDAHLLLVAEAPGAHGPEIVGAVMGGWDGRRGWVYHLGVDADWRRRGIGSALVAEVERRLEAMGCPKVLLMVRDDNPGVVSFYRRLGYGGEDVRVLSRWLVPPAGPGPAPGDTPRP